MNPWEILPWLAVPTAIVLAIAWFNPVRETTIVVTYLFGGRILRILRPGVHFIPWPIEITEVIETPTRQFQLPDERERIDRVSQVPPTGMTKPYRINHNPYNEALWWIKKGWLQNRQGDPFDYQAKTLDTLEPVRFKDLPQEVQNEL